VTRTHNPVLHLLLGGGLVAFAALLAPCSEAVTLFPTTTFTDWVTSNAVTSYGVNVLRRFDPATGSIVTTAALGAAHNMSAGNTYGAIDFWEAGTASGGDPGEWLVSSTVGNPAAVAQLEVDLHQTLTLNAVRVNWRDTNQQPVSYAIEGWTGSIWVPLVPATTADGAAATYTNTFADTAVSKLRLTGTGLRTGQTNMRVNEIMAFVAGSAPAPTTDQGYNLSAIASITETQLSTGQLNGLGGRSLTDQNTLTRVTCVNTMSADGILVVDYQDVYRAFLMRLDFWGTQTFPAGGLVEISLDNSSWTTILDTGASPLGTTLFNWSAAPLDLRYVRVTARQNAAGSNNTRFADLEIYTMPVPEPGAALLLGLALAALPRRRRRV
jgi:hypothetical protein